MREDQESVRSVRNHISKKRKTRLFSLSPRLQPNNFLEKGVFILGKMPVAVALWSVCEFPLRVCTLNSRVRSTVVKPGQSVSVIPQSDLVITNAALGSELADSAGRTSVKLTYMRPVKITPEDEDEGDDEVEGDDEAAQVETVLCSFTPGKVLHMYHWRIDSRN
jgi:hypothetical protein